MSQIWVKKFKIIIKLINKIIRDVQVDLKIIYLLNELHKLTQTQLYSIQTCEKCVGLNHIGESYQTLSFLYHGVMLLNSLPQIKK